MRWAVLPTGLLCAASACIGVTTFGPSEDAGVAAPEAGVPEAGDARADAAASPAGDGGPDVARSTFCDQRDASTLLCRSFEEVDTLAGWVVTRAGGDVGGDTTLAASGQKSMRVEVPALGGGNARSVSMATIVPFPSAKRLRLSAKLRTKAGQRPVGTVLSLDVRGAALAGGSVPTCQLIFQPRKEVDERFYILRSFFNADAGDGGRIDVAPPIAAELLSRHMPDDVWTRISLVIDLPSPGSLVGHIRVEDEQVELSWSAVKFSSLSTEGCPHPIQTVQVSLAAQSSGEEQVRIHADDLELVAE